MKSLIFTLVFVLASHAWQSSTAATIYQFAVDSTNSFVFDPGETGGLEITDGSIEPVTSAISGFIFLTYYSEPRPFTAWNMTIEFFITPELELPNQDLLNFENMRGNIQEDSIFGTNAACAFLENCISSGGTPNIFNGSFIDGILDISGEQAVVFLGTKQFEYTIKATVSAVPVPGTFLLLLSAVVALCGIKRRASWRR